MSFLKNKRDEQLSKINNLSSGKERSELVKVANILFNTMHNVGINNENDYRDFYYIKSNAPYFYKEIIKRNPTNKEIAIISSILYKNRNENPINTISNFYKATEAAINSLETITKKAYPQGYEGSHIQPPYNLPKWVDTMRQVYVLKNKGLSKYEAIDKITEKWDKMEINDFKHWFKFYESNSHLAYKTASFEEQMVPSDMDTLHISLPVANKEEDIENTDMPEKIQDVSFSKRPYRKRQKQELTLNDKVNRLIGRLNSAEKLYTSDNFRELLGNEYEAWLSTLHQLKRKIQISVFKNASTVDDVVYSFSNKLANTGFSKSASLILKVAQEVPSPPSPPPVGSGGDINVSDKEEPEKNAEPSELPTSEEEPLESNLFNDMPDSSLSGTDSGDEEGEDNLDDPDAAMDEFMENLGAKSSKKKASLYNNSGINITESDYVNYKKAQITPPIQSGVKPGINPLIPAPTPTLTPTPTAKQTEKPQPSSGFDIDDRIDNAFKSISIDDVIKKLDSLVLYYKNRPAVSELTKIDLAMQQLGLAAYFPNMAEATKSALDSNQYVLTRIEDILAKLKGAYSIQSGQLEAIKDKFNEADEAAEIKNQKRQLQKMTDDGSEDIDIKLPNNKPEDIDIKNEIKAPSQIQPSKTPGVRVT